MLNLLPPEIKEKNRARSLLYSVILTYVILAVVAVLAYIGLTTWKFVQQTEIGAKEQRLEQLSGQKKTKNEVITKAALVEDRLKSSSQFRENDKWEEVLNQLASATPVDTKLTNISIAKNNSGEGLSVSLTGKSTDRRSIVLFRDKLATNKSFGQLAIQSLTESTTKDVKEFIFSLAAIYTVPKETPTQ